jgi:hypothetical protein
MNPEVRLRREWRNLKLKRLLGYRAWRLLSPLVTGLRKLSRTASAW